MNMIKNAIIPISGFTQNIGSPTGFDKLWEGLRPLSSPTTTLFQPVAWKENMADKASFLHRHLDQGDHTILVAAYSWGCGWGFTQLAKECNKRGLKIKAAVLCDPVYRSGYFWMRFRTMFNRIPIITPKIKIPPNVREVYSYFQRQNKPQAHELVAQGTDEQTRIHQRIQLSGLNHQYMDDSEIFHDHVTDLFTKILSN